MTNKKNTPFILLDRDGTLIIDKNYLHNPDEVTLFPDTIESLKLLQEAGCRFAVVTNQSGVGRGYYSIDEMKSVNDKLSHILEESGVILNTFYCCPHTPKDCCLCRKPEPGLFHQAAKDFHIEAANTYIVGDKASDVMLAKNVGAIGILVTTGYGKSEKEKIIKDADYIADSLFDVAKWILADWEKNRS